MLVKNGGVLERLAKVTTAILDKSGTLTRGAGRRRLDQDERLHLGERDTAIGGQPGSGVGARRAAALIEAARSRGLSLSPPDNVRETPGTGLKGRVEGRHVVVGGNTFVRDRSDGTDPRSLQSDLAPELAIIAVAIDGQVAGVIVLEDPVRPDAAALLSDLRRSGIARVVLASGDRTQNSGGRRVCTGRRCDA